MSSIRRDGRSGQLDRQRRRERRREEDCVGRWMNEENAESTKISPQFTILKRPTPSGPLSTPVSSSAVTSKLAGETNSSSSQQNTQQNEEAPTTSTSQQQQQVKKTNDTVKTPFPLTRPIHLKKNNENAAALESKVLEATIQPYKFQHDASSTFIDTNLRMQDCGQFENSNEKDYFVITVIGRKNCGKSTLLSYLSGGKTEFGPTNIFKTRDSKQTKESTLFVNSDNIILIEMCPLYCGKAAIEMISLLGQQESLETSVATLNLKICRLALSISHVVIVLSEHFFEPNILQLFTSCQVIQKLEFAFGDGEYPELFYVCNKVSLAYLDPLKYKKYPELFNIATEKKPRILPNFFVLPRKSLDFEYGVKGKYAEFKKAIYDYNRFKRAPFDSRGRLKKINQITLKEWFNFATRCWDEMHHPNFFASYAKLLP